MLHTICDGVIGADIDSVIDRHYDYHRHGHHFCDTEGPSGECAFGMERRSVVSQKEGCFCNEASRIDPFGVKNFPLVQVNQNSVGITLFLVVGKVLG